MIVYNKTDLLDGGEGETLLVNNRDEEAVFVSAHTGAGLERFEAAVAHHLDLRSNLVRATLPAAAGGLVARLRRAGSCLDETYHEDGRVELLLRLPDQSWGLIQGELESDVCFEVLEPARERVFSGEPESDERPPWMQDRA